eukprot:IDg6253t1
MWKLNSWIYEQFERLGGKLACVLGNKRNCNDFFALLRKVYRLCPLWFSINWQGGSEVPEEKQRRSLFIGFDPWCNEYLQEYKSELRFHTLPWDVPVKPGAGTEIQPLLAYPTLNIPVAAAINCWTQGTGHPCRLLTWLAFST